MFCCRYGCCRREREIIVVTLYEIPRPSRTELDMTNDLALGRREARVYRQSHYILIAAQQHAL